MLAASSEARESAFMKAVRFARHGKPDVLTIEDIAELSAGDGEAVVRIRAASINPSDVKTVGG